MPIDIEIADMIINRDIETKVKYMATKMPIIAIIGPRQSGKTTFTKLAFPDYTYVTLEDPDNRSYATTDPRGFLLQYNKKVIFDEAQKAPELFSYLQTYSDENPIPGNYILTGSQHFLLNEKISQSLAGRVAIFTLLPLSLKELHTKNLEEIIFTGFYPRIYASNLAPNDWYPGYIQTYIERDVRQITNILDLNLFQKFLKLCAGRTGQLLNLSSLANDCGITHNTAKSWIGLLEASFIVFLLPPYHKNFGKRLIKSPKLYFHDTGIVCSLLNIENPAQLTTNYARGSLFENLIISELIKNYYNQGRIPKLFFWRDQIGHEIDCINEYQNTIEAIELKSGKTIAQDFFVNLTYLQEITDNFSTTSYVVYGGDNEQLRSKTKVISWRNIDKYLMQQEDN
jgi:hypothetical protein